MKSLRTIFAWIQYRSQYPQTHPKKTCQNRSKNNQVFGRKMGSRGWFGTFLIWILGSFSSRIFLWWSRGQILSSVGVKEGPKGQEITIFDLLQKNGKIWKSTKIYFFETNLIFLKSEEKTEKIWKIYKNRLRPILTGDPIHDRFGWILGAGGGGGGWRGNRLLFDTLQRTFKGPSKEGLQGAFKGELSKTLPRSSFWGDLKEPWNSLKDLWGLTWRLPKALIRMPLILVLSSNTPIALYKKPQGTGEGTLIFLGLGHILAPFWVHLGVV